MTNDMPSSGRWSPNICQEINLMHLLDKDYDILITKDLYIKPASHYTISIPDTPTSRPSDNRR